MFSSSVFPLIRKLNELNIAEIYVLRAEKLWKNKEENISVERAFNSFKLHDFSILNEN